ncbi:MAG: hypothetical protein ACXVGH_11930, partial [Mycobacteriales bacterium]
DGVGTPDAPYRYVGTSPAPSAAQQTVEVGPTSSAALSLRTGETGPQALVDAGTGALRDPHQATAVVTLSPESPGVAPPQGSFDGNVYRLAAPDGVSVAPDAQGFLFLRAAVMTRPDPVVVHRPRPGDAWKVLPTTRAGRDILSVPLRELGDYTVVRRPGSKPLSGGGLTATRLLLLAGGTVLLLGLAVLALRKPASG